MSVNSVARICMLSKHSDICIDLQIRDDSDIMADSLYFRTFNEINPSEKLNLIRLADDGVRCIDLYCGPDPEKSK